ncbi:MAG: hypothetical protein LKF42_09595 [Streptococcaceae bacterium]|jgi:hypothetical protein|nr:hypothetical protein [Streptococcaceae bacterium]MCH4178116.1 hypothetical protein [Streptococcaceae bacterium]
MKDRLINTVDVIELIDKKIETIEQSSGIAQLAKLLKFGNNDCAENIIYRNDELVEVLKQLRMRVLEL